MPSLGSILSVAGSGLRAQQQALEVTAHNIANVNTEGYSRQTPVFTQRPPLATPEGVFGTGVSLEGVQRTRDAFADASYWSEAGLESRHGTRRDMVSRVETLLVEPGDQGLSAALDRFFSAWSGLASNPSDTVPRQVVLDAGQAVVGELHRLSAGLDTVAGDAEVGLSDGLERVNALARDLARLNQEVVAQESAGETASDLRDERGRAVDALAELVSLRTFEQDDGSLRIVTEGHGLVDGTSYGRLESVLVGGVRVIRPEGGTTPLDLQGGRLAGYLDTLNVDVPTVRQDLDALTAELVGGVNALHAGGTNPAGATGVDFFDPARTTASTIALSVAIAGRPEQVAAGTGTTDPVPAYRSGANDVALQLSGLRDETIAGLSGTFGEHFVSTVTGVGTTVRAARDEAEVHGVLKGQAAARRESAAGVSVDEELVQLIRFQSAYGAAARVVTTADEMLESLIRM